MAGLEIVYTSPRRICARLRRLVEGTARVYGETLEVEEPECMHRGARRAGSSCASPDNGPTCLSRAIDAY